MRQEKGITLIALVITIIVLLILAGVTIAMLSGADNAPAKANEAALKDALAAGKDAVSMKVVDLLQTYYTDTYVASSRTTGTTGARAYILTQITPANSITSDNVKIEITNAETNNITITSTKNTACKVQGTLTGNGGISWGDYQGF